VKCELAAKVPALRRFSCHIGDLSAIDLRSFFNPMRRHAFLPVILFAILTAAPSARSASSDRLELAKGDHISIVGSAVAERMQHHGWLETLIYNQFPADDLVVRNLAFSGDEVKTRARSENFGTPDDWLRRNQTDVVLAFFGFNESFGSYAGLEKFKKELDEWLDHVLAEKYNGRSAPRIVLFSPLAHEDLHDPNLPDGSANNANILHYRDAMADAAKARGIPFVDLFKISQDLYAKAREPLTINGIHLKESGDKVLAPQLFQALFPGSTVPSVEGNSALEALRRAILGKNEMWFSRYRTVDGYNVYGGRSQLKYNDVTNFKVMQEEMSVRDVMTANRDRAVWAAAQKRPVKIDDSNVPKVSAVPTNKPGAGPEGKHEFLSGEAAIAHMKVPAGCKVNLFASEEQFPELANPVQMAWDTRGRLWVAAWPNYPERTPWSKDGDSLLVFEDTNADGKADRMTRFLADLNCPTGFQFYKDGVLVMQAPDLWFVRDTDGDGKADWRERILHGMDSADSHHTTNSMCLDPGGAVYLSDGVFHRTQVETLKGPVRNQDAAIYRFEPRTFRFEKYIAYSFANPHGRVFDYWGNDIVTDATGNANYFGPAFSGRLDSGKHPSMKEFWKRPSRPCPGTGILSSRHFPAEFDGNFLNCNVIGIQGIFRVKVTEDGSGLAGETLENMVTSDDPNFRPSAVSMGPDGAVYFLDWHNPIIGHMQHHLRDPSRDHTHGRIYRITYEGRPLSKPAKIAGEPIAALLELLKAPENNVRERAHIELGNRPTAEVIRAVDAWMAKLDAADPAFAHHLTEALWVKQSHNVADEALLKKMLRFADPHARAAATRVLCYQRDRIPDALALLKVQAEDEHPRVRLEAVRAASFFDGKDAPKAIEVAYSILAKPTDYYLDYTLKETVRQLNSLSRQLILPTEPAVLAAAVQRMSDEELGKAPDIEPVLLARIDRRGTDPAQRERAITALAKLHGTERDVELVQALERLDHNGRDAATASTEIGKLLNTATPAALGKARPQLAALAAKATQPATRRAAWGALVSADGNASRTWAEAASDASRQALLEALSAVIDPALRAQFQPLLITVLNDEKTSEPTRRAALRALPLTGPANAGANFALLASHLSRGVARADAARALMQLPRDSWSRTAAPALVDSILTWARTVPAGQRTSQEYVELVQTGDALAGLLPSADAARARKEFRGLGVSVSVVKTVREQMRYDTTRLVVAAGKPFEIIFENVDMMPHNLVLAAPGARQAVAESVQTRRPDQLDKQGRAYVPEKDTRVIAATKMLDPGQKETLKLTAPKEEGEYDYVCTFPGHWMIMWGKWIVTNDVDAYLRAHPEPPPQVPGVPGVPAQAALHHH
jgi:azurin/glucose/arabinose dehydrogenase/lysophospholipase L1-like esterase